MDNNFATELRSLIDHLATRGVTMLSVRQGDERLRVTLGTAIQAVPERTIPEPLTITAAGPGLFRPRHPAGAALACIEAGDFLFPVAPIHDSDEMLVQEGTVVGYGTPLIRHGSQIESHRQGSQVHDR
ncbi:hypothetical protein [Halomonas sp. AOP42-B2-16]|uniref:hypothetical protein n=1 Tax=Halomonas sp. AOP42-B2-16 TaxID=3457673 RepID=UPI004033BC08